MKNVLKRIYGVIKEIHSEDGNWSSKRVYGGFIIIVVCLSLIYSLYRCVNVVDALVELKGIIETMLYVGVGLIGLATIIPIVEAAKGKPQKTQTPPTDENISQL